MIKINKTKEFQAWLSSLTIKEQFMVDARLDRIHNLEYFGDAKSLGNGLAELRWKNGWRVYFVKEKASIILLLNGGNKMRRKKISKKQEFSFKNMQETKITKSKDITELNPEKAFMDLQKVGTTLFECLIDNDTETFIEILDSYLRINRLQVAKKAKMSRSTIQLALSKGGNPTLKTIAKIVHESSLKKNQTR
jgi:putative addiction module killer protein